MAARNWETELWKACRDGDIRTAQEAVDNNVNVNWENSQEHNYTPLHRATIYGKEELVQLLLGNGANPNTISKNKRTPLTSAALYGYKTIVKLLLDNGANIETPACDHEQEMLTPLHLAAQNSHNEIVLLLIERRAKIDPKTNEGNTPLHLASQKGNPAVIQWLHKHGADLFIRNKAGRTPLDLAREEKNYITCSYLEDCMKLGIGLHKEEVLWTACHDGDVDKAKEAVASGANCNWANGDFNGYTPLHIATLYGHETIVEMLLKAGANPSPVSESGDIPLITAAREGYEEIVELLLECQNADIDTTDSHGSTALHKAAKHSHKEVVKHLISKGANVNLKNEKGNTPLHLSSKEGHPMVLMYLLQHNANPTAENKDGKTALNLAEDQNNSISIGILLGESNEAFLWNSCKSGELAKVKELCISKSVKVSWRSPACNDYTSLHIATIYGRDEVVKLLLENGADPNDSNRNGFSPLITAANNEDLVIFNYLLKWNANINYQGIHRDTALHRAAKHSYRIMVQILVERRAKLDLLNKDDNTPLHMASMEGHATVVRYLIRKGANAAITNKQGKTAFDLAEDGDHHPILEELKKAQTTAASHEHDSATETHEHMDTALNSSCVDEKLWNKAAKGDFQAVENALKAKAGDPTWKNKKYLGYTAIHVATLHGHDKVVEVLLNHGSCAHSTNSADETALHIAAREGDYSLVHKLLYHRDVPKDAKNSKGNTALHIAVQKSHRAIVKLLVQKEADFNLSNKEGNTPLHLASREGHVVLVRRLLGNGAKTDILNHEGHTAQDIENQLTKTLGDVPENEYTEVANVTSSYCEARTVIEDKQKQSEELWKACYENNMTGVKQLLAAEAFLSWTNPCLMKYSCLHVAVMFGHTEIVNLLLNAGEEMYCDYTGNDQEHTPLHVAALEGRVEVAKLLVNKGANRNIKDCNHCSPLHLAVMNGHWKMVEYLCDCKVPLDEKNEDGNTALHIAVGTGKVVLAKKLFMSGAHTDVKNKKKKIPMDLAKENDYKFLVTLLDINYKPDEYPTDTPTRGYCIIINNHKFGQLAKDRPGSERDVKVLKNLFEDQLGFKVETYMDLKGVDMVKKMKEVQRYHHGPCLVVIIMSHGSAGGVWGTDCLPVPVTQLTSCFSDSRCPSLVGKAKIFLIQACRDIAKDEDVHISEPVSQDMDITLATIHGEYAYRSPESGSFFIQAFVETMNEYAATKHYKEIITNVTNKVSQTKGNQVPVQRTTLRKCLYLKPVRNTSIPSIIAQSEDSKKQQTELVIGLYVLKKQNLAN